MIASDLKNKKIYFFRLSKISIELIKYFNANDINFTILFDKYFDTLLKEYCVNNGLATNQQFCDIDIFDEKYVPLDYALIDKLIHYTDLIDKKWSSSDEYTVSASMDANGKMVFWDIQTPAGKSKILRRNI